MSTAGDSSSGRGFYTGQLEGLVDMPASRALLDGVTAGVVGIIASTTLGLVPQAIHGAATLALFAAALVILYQWHGRASVPAVILGAGAAGGLLL